ncbi:MAG: succinate dehydrogenase, cytochrome b556 subunit [Actinobacteria bacterium]|nr:succinate dehydrogenase, cytochrome b556 subunit [Actinomycetota bacterium]
MARKKSVYGPIYRGREGQWSWILHRATGVGVILFLFAHVVDTAVVGWGPDAYNRVVAVYHNPFIQFLELVLVGMVIYHAFNGVRIMIIDFWPKASEYHVPIFYATAALFVAAMVPVTWIIGRNILEALF